MHGQSYGAYMAERRTVSAFVVDRPSELQYIHRPDLELLQQVFAMTKPVSDMTPAEMDDWLSNAWRTMKVTEQEAEAKAFYRAGEFVRELGRRIEALSKART